MFVASDITIMSLIRGIKYEILETIDSVNKSKKILVKKRITMLKKKKEISDVVYLQNWK